MKTAQRLLLVVLVLSCLTLPMEAQQPTGTINGVVLDPSGAAVAGAKVTVASEATGFSRQATSAEDGTYVFPLLPGATYNLSAEAPGFRRTERKGILLNANISLIVNLELQVGEITESIRVEERGIQVDTSTGTLRQVIEEHQVVELPLVDRNPTRLVLLSAGTSLQMDWHVTAGGGEQANSISGFGYPSNLVISSSGARGDGMNYVLDGGNNRDSYLNVNNPVPNPDALKELVVQTNNVSAEHGSATGGVVTIVTKSGTNSFHGSAFDFLRNTALNATPFFNKALAPNPAAALKDVLKRNQFGGTAGGPIIRNKLFFFASYQGLYIRRAATRTRYRVLTDLQRQGFFDDTNGDGRVDQRDTPVAINRVSAALLDYIPHAENQATGEIFLNKRQNEHENQALAKVDYTGGKNQIFGKYFDSRYPREMIPAPKGNIFAGMGGNSYTYRSLSAGLNSVFSASLINNLTFAFYNLHSDAFGASPVGMNDFNPKVAGSRELRIAFGGGLSTISSGFLGRDRTTIRNSYQFTDNAHRIFGKHDLGFGGDWTRMSLNYANTYRQAGFYTFTSPKNFMMGSLRTLIQGGGEFTEKTYWNRSLYVNDNFRVSNQLTLNLGLRWDPFDPPRDQFLRAMCFSPGTQSTRFPNAPAGVIFAGEAGCPEAGFNKVWTNFAPRLGLAYNIGGRSKTTLRGGIGLAYQPPFLEALNNLVANPPFSPQVALSNTKLDDPYGYLGRSSPFPAKYGPRAGSPDDTFDLPAITTSYQSNWKPPRAWSFNLTLERQLLSDVLVRAAYVGARGGKLGFNTDFNYPRTPKDLENGVRPYPNFQKMTQNQSKGSSSYNALQLGVNKRFSKGLLVEAHYTWSKSLDEGSSVFDLDSLTVFNPLNPLGYRAVSDFNVMHRFVANYVWELPTLWKQGMLHHVLGGWQLSGIWSAQSGAPFSVTSENNIGDDYEVPGPMAIITGTPRLTSGSKGQKIQRWFDTSVFTITPDNSYGSSPRNVLHGPGIFTVDFGLSKSFKLTEALKLQYRAEFINAFNRANFFLPDSWVGSADGLNPDFGRITGTRDPRIIQMALKLTW